MILFSHSRRYNIMDFKGQLLAYYLCYGIILAFALIGAIVGIVSDSFYNCFLVIASGGIVASVICIPDWPMYNRKPIVWANSKKEE